MANFLFRIVDTAKDPFYVRAVGADLEEARADAITKWESWAAANTPDTWSHAQRVLDAEPVVTCMASDDGQYSPNPWPNYVE